MRNKWILVILILAIVSLPAAADYIHLKNGKVLQVANAEVKGDFVVFNYGNGTMSIELVAVSKIEKTNDNPENMPVLSSGVSSSGPPVRSGQGARPMINPIAGSGETGQPGSDEQNPNEDLIQYYIQQKQQLEVQIAMAQEQIKTLNSVIYAKAAIFSDTTKERNRIAEFERQINEANDRLEQIYRNARRDGLSPGEIRRIEDAKTDIPVATDTDYLP